jgi:hypothetical protein
VKGRVLHTTSQQRYGRVTKAPLLEHFKERLKAVGKTWILLLTLLTCCLRANAAQHNVDFSAVQKAIVFMYGADAHGHEDASAPQATGFLVAIPDKGDVHHGSIVLITARHVVDPVWGGCGTANPTRLFMRLNTLGFNPSTDETGVDYVAIDLIASGPSRNIFTSVDASVDAAVIVLTPSVQKAMAKFDFREIPLSDFATRDEAKALNTGDEVVSVGLLPDFPGVRRNYPITKFGHISTKPQERVRVRCSPKGPLLTNPLRIWFVAANLVSGNSGSPVLFVPTLFSGQRALLIGVQSCSWEGSDIAGMTPIEYVFEIIESMDIPNADLFRGSRQDKKP